MRILHGFEVAQVFFFRLFRFLFHQVIPYGFQEGRVGIPGGSKQCSGDICLGTHVYHQHPPVRVSLRILTRAVKRQGRLSNSSLGKIIEILIVISDSMVDIIGRKGKVLSPTLSILSQRD